MAAVTEQKSGELKNTSYELFIGALSLLSIFNLVFYYLAKDQDIINVLYIMDGILSLIFISDFTYRLFTTESKSGYFFQQMGWADLLASIPAPAFKILRMFRLLRVYRLMKIYGGKRMITEFFENRGGSALLILSFLIILLLEFGGLSILWVESQSPNANITTASDAVWYVYVTITTVGYGDQYPVTNTGRIIGTIIMTIGVGLFGTIAAFLANFFIGPGEDAPTEPETTASEPESALPESVTAEAGLEGLTGQMEEIRKILLANEKTNTDLLAKLQGIEEILQKTT